MCNSYMVATMSSPVTDTALNIKTTLMRDDIDLDARVITTTSLKKKYLIELPLQQSPLTNILV